MILDLDIQTNAEDTVVDYIEMMTSNGEKISLDWDMSESSYLEDDNSLCMSLKGVNFNGVCADGCLEKIIGATIGMLGIHSESDNPLKLKIESIYFVDGISTYKIPKQTIDTFNMVADEKIDRT